MSPPVLRPAAVGPDPRILARRIAVRRDEGRRRLRRLLWVTGAAGVALLASLTTRTPLLDVDHVRIAGVARVPTADVLGAASAAGADRGSALVGLDEGAVERAVEALPGIAAADVARDWPGAVTIEVVERTPVAVVTSGGVTALVAADGVIVDIVEGAPAGLPRLAGTDGALEAGAVVDAPELLAVAAALPPEVAAAVVTVGPSADPGGLELRLADGGAVRLGPGAELGAKLVAVATILEQVDVGCLAVLDVRVPSAPAITRTSGCSS